MQYNPKMKSADMFEQFSPTNKDSWKNQIEKDLKGKPYSELIWNLNNEQSFEPFYTKEEIGQTSPLASRSGNNWQIAEQITVVDCRKANATALEGLLGGADALEINISKNLSSADMAALFDGIELPFISVHFNLETDDLELVESVLKHFSNQVTAREFNPAEIRGSISYYSADKPEIWEKIGRLMSWAKTALPGFQLLAVGADTQLDAEDKLLTCLENAVVAMDKLSDLGMPVHEIHKHIRFRLPIGKQYFVEIANIRALKLLWLHVQKAYKIGGLETPPISAAFDNYSYDNEQNTNMIRATTMALSATIGGVDCLIVKPSDEKGETAFQRRIARNVQHLLKMESYIDRVADPAAGAYYIEKMTSEIAARVWEKFISRQA